MEDLSLHILDIAENSIAADARTVQIHVKENKEKDILTLKIIDDGRGMDKEQVSQALDPFFTTKKTRRFGFGLSLLQESAKAANGDFSISSQSGKGTSLKATFQMSHIDMKPLGDIPQTMGTLIMGHPEVDFLYTHSFNGKRFAVSTKDIKIQLEGIPINSPEVIKVIQTNIKEGLDNIRRSK